MNFLGLNLNSVCSTGFSSLTEQSSQLLKDYGIQVTKKGLNDRYNEYSVNFMKTLFSQTLTLSLGEKLRLEKFDGFTGIYLKDTTGKQLPACYVELFKGSGGSSSQSGLKVDFAYNILSDDCEMALRDGASNDANSPLRTYKKGSLHLWDLGYFCTKTFEEVMKAEAFFVSRYKLSTNLYQDFKDKNGSIHRKVITIKALTKGMRVNEIKNCKVYLGSKKQIEVRLVIQKLPKKIADKRKRKLKKNSKKTPSSEKLKACEYILMITNIDQQIFDGKEILKVYGIRWQIEILFKGWKSVMKFGQVHAMKKHRFLCMLYGHLIWITLTMKIISWSKITFWNKYHIQLSELKAFKIIRQYQHDLLALFYQKNFNSTQLAKIIHDIQLALFLFAEKEEKKLKGKRHTINLFSIN